jgi:hypothetical protein
LGKIGGGRVEGPGDTATIEENSGKLHWQPIHSSSSCTPSCDSFIIHFNLFINIISQKKPTCSPTTPLKSPPTSSPTFAPGVSPVPPLSGGTRFVPNPSGGCTLNPANGAGNGCSIEAHYCMVMVINNENVCSACTGLDSDCNENANGTYCVRAFTQSGYACAVCSLNVTGSCSGNQTCGTPSCIADMIEYCSEDHDAGWCPVNV